MVSDCQDRVIALRWWEVHNEIECDGFEWQHVWFDGDWVNWDFGTDCVTLCGLTGGASFDVLSNKGFHVGLPIALLYCV
jgi:hypothetical protein